MIGISLICDDRLDALNTACDIAHMASSEDDANEWLRDARSLYRRLLGLLDKQTAHAGGNGCESTGPFKEGAAGDWLLLGMRRK